ncbi:MAG: YceI family protein [Actinomycetes bacterium]
MATATMTRRAARRAAPPEGTWAIDPHRAVVAFSGRSSFLAPAINARFRDVAGTVEVGGPVGAEHSVRVEVDVTSMTTGNRAYDEVIAAFDPFDAARFPVAVYRSSAVTWTPDGVRIDGTLTLRGVTRPVALTAAYDVGRTADRMIVRAGGSVDREAFGVRFDVPGVGKLVPRVLRLEIDVDVTLVA